MKRLSYALLIVILFVGITGCGSSTSSEPEEPPQTPNLEQGQPDVSYFQNNNPKTSEVTSTNNFSQARGVVLFNSIFFNFGQNYGIFLNETDQTEATYNNGVWEWTYSSSYAGVSADYRAIAEELSNSIRWALYWSYDDGQGNGYEDYKIFEGTVANDESTGDWTFNALDTELEEEIPFITSSWNKTSDTEKEITLEMFGNAMDDKTSEKTATINYERNGADYTMELDFTDGENYLVTWNTDTNTGSISVDGDVPKCWDENFQDVPCE